MNPLSQHDAEENAPLPQSRRPIDTRTLFARGRDLQLPACMAMRVDGDASPQPLELLRAFRVLPRRRVVALARWQGQLVVAKIFFARGRWAGHLEREARGVSAIAALGIATPALLATGKGADGDCGILLLQYLDDSESVGQRWERSDSAERSHLLCRVVTLIAQCHALGLQQRDIHLDNFLLQNDVLYLLDAAAIEKRTDDAEGIDSVNSLRNLALFFAQFPISNDGQVPALYEHYRQQRPLADISSDIGVFSSLLHKKRLARLKVVTDKLFRSTTANVCHRQWNRFEVHRRSLDSPALRQFIAAPDVFLAQGRLLKKGNTSTVALIQIDGAEHVLKRYNIKSLWHAVSRLFRPSRAWVCWRNAHMLEMFGIATASPLLMMERRCGILRREAWYLSEYVPGEDALHFLEKEPINSRAWELALEQFKNLFLIMQDYGIVHGDMKATNFISTEQGLTVLDLDAMRLEPDRRRFDIAFRKDLQRFVGNWSTHPQIAARVQEMIAQVLSQADNHTEGT